jgi:hypothetical protein
VLAVNSSRHVVPPHRRYIAERAAKFLPPAIVIRQIFGAQCFFPWLIGPLYLLYAPFKRWRVVAIADEGIFVFAARFWFDWRPTRLLRTLPRDTLLGPPHGIWSRIQIGPERAWVNMRFFPDVNSANTDLRHRPATAQQLSIGEARAANPALGLLGATISWTAEARKGRWYTAKVDGLDWMLHVDESNQGTRYILETGGRAVHEVPFLPAEWTLGASQSRTGDR